MKTVSKASGAKEFTTCLRPPLPSPHQLMQPAAGVTQTRSWGVTSPLPAPCQPPDPGAGPPHVAPHQAHTGQWWLRLGGGGPPDQHLLPSHLPKLYHQEACAQHHLHACVCLAVVTWAWGWPGRPCCPDLSGEHHTCEFTCLPAQLLFQGPGHIPWSGAAARVYLSSGTRASQ
jgi:hypothetical protein